MPFGLLFLLVCGCLLTYSFFYDVLKKKKVTSKKTKSKEELENEKA